MNTTLETLKTCWVERAMIPLVKARCNNLENRVLLKFAGIRSGNSKNSAKYANATKANDYYLNAE